MEEHRDEDVDEIENHDYRKDGEVNCIEGPLRLLSHFHVIPHIKEEEEDLKVIRDIEGRVETHDEAITRIVDLKEGKGEIGREMEGGENQKSKKGILVTPTVFLHEKFNDVDEKDDESDQTDRCIENGVVAHGLIILQMEVNFYLRIGLSINSDRNSLLLLWQFCDMSNV